jgi:RimJ/RimL family protein N-acetyltransferase
MKIVFKPLKLIDCQLLHQWLQLAHVRQFWDDGERKLIQVIKHYMTQGNTKRFLFYLANNPVGYIQWYTTAPTSQLMHQAQLSKAVGIDLFIGNVAYLNKGYSFAILNAFITKYCCSAPYIMVDPAVTNFKAIHIYEKLGFQKYFEFLDNGICYQLMVKANRS